MKKLSVLAILLLIVGLLAVPALAAQNATMSVSVSSGTVHRGDTFKVTVSTTAVADCKAGVFMFVYNTSVFEYVSGSVTLDGYTSGISTADGKLAGYFMNGQTTVQGALVEITLKVKDTAAYGSYTISGAPSLSAADGNVSCSVSGATVTVACNHNWSEWTKVDDTQHKRTCSVCGKDDPTNHTWDNGQVTKQPTCKEEGIKNYTCTGCPATKTEPVAKTNEHTYGNWSKVDNTQHKHACTVCGKEESANHAWDNGQITKQHNCKEEGVKTYTCTGCSATKTEPVAKSNEHTYGNWSKVNDTQHKHACTVCGKEESANHTWDNGKITKQPNCKEEGIKTYTCTGCSATKTEPVAKSNEHTYGNWSKVNDTQHKHACTVCGKEESANHVWDNGKITKQPNCKEEGVKTYTCTGCSATKTEPVAKSNEHTYGNWSKVNDTQHKHSCTVCGKEESANHSWDNGLVTKQPTCKEDGILTYGCAECSATKTEALEKLTTHTYDHACDTDCNVCGVTRTITHNYKTAWSNDGQNHWHECSVCKDKKDVADHTPGAEATEYTPQTCTACGYIIKPALGHKHKYSTELITDEKGHWYACSGCNEKDSFAEHDFENDCDADCSICGYTRQIKHAFSETWSSDETSHWRVCTVCDLEQDKAAHLPGAEATATTAQTCTVCDYEIAPALGVPEITTETTEITTIGETPAENSTGSSVVWIVLVAAAVVAAGAGAVIVIKKKKA